MAAAGGGIAQGIKDGLANPKKEGVSAMRIPKIISAAVVLSLLILALVPAAARAQAGGDRAYHLHDRV
jgi:hypothetical protein